MTEQPKRIEKDLLPTIPPPEWEFHTVLGAPHGCMLLPGDQGPVVVRRQVSYGDWEPVRPDRWAEPNVNDSSVVAAEEMHQGPGVYGGLETHRGARHECPAPDCGPQGVQITRNPDGEDSALIHFPEVDYADTQPWSADIGVSTDTLRELRDAIDAHLDKGAKTVDEPATGGHIYLSTGCLHGEHTYCQSMTGQQGKKRPGRCKLCDAQCSCSCHNEGEAL